MKKLFLSSLFAFAIAGALISCNKDSGLTDSMPMKTSPGGGGTSNPALVYAASTGGRTAFETVAVMNSDGTNQTNIYTAGSTTTAINTPSWSADGKSVAWIENGKVLKACDVSVVNGVATGSNVRTIYTSTVTITNQAWCSVAATAEIAFWSGGTSANLYVISTNGGTPTLLYSSATNFSWPTWSPDDSKIAVMEFGIHKSALRILDATTGATLDHPDFSNFYEALHPEWARSGNSIAFDVEDTNVGTNNTHIYYYTALSGNAPTTQNTVGGYPTWSPDDANLMIEAGNAKGVNTVYEIPAFGTTKTDIATVGLTGIVKWKR